MLPTESQVNRLGFFGLWNYSIPSCEIQQVHSPHRKNLFCVWCSGDRSSIF